ncbi:unnamed protein product [Danaus chrysippus]|uniref:(African queen) hypothetical protein n=1 Tax=Danaus chrysippus TaxID=151541 RepID=A0A8J2QUD1_9NEOP|nr:unnamed protein product [Danaus chrysippus]
MMNYSFRYYNHIRQFNSGVLAFTNKSNIGNSRNYAKDKGGCKETPQHEGKRVESWPKPDPPPPAWRCECPWEPQPPNYDPYRIKVPDIAVPPLPPSNAKETHNEVGKGFFQNNNSNSGCCLNNMQDLFQNSPIVHPDYWKDKPEKRATPPQFEVQDPLPKLGYHGKYKYMYAFHEPWKPLDRLSLLAQAEKEETQKTEESLITGNSDKQIV